MTEYGARGTGRHRVDDLYHVCKGGIDACPTHPAEIFKAALVTNSPAFTLVNKPSERRARGSQNMRLVSRDGIVPKAERSEL